MLLMLCLYSRQDTIYSKSNTTFERDCIYCAVQLTTVQQKLTIVKITGDFYSGLYPGPLCHMPDLILLDGNRLCGI